MLQTTLDVFFVENYAWSSSIGFETMDALEIRKFVFEFPIWNSWITFVHVLRTIAIQEHNFFSKLYVETQEKGMQSQEISLVAIV